jgi:actin-related protein 3
LKKISGARKRSYPISMFTAEKVKEEYCYVSPDIVKEFARYDREPDRFLKHTVTT